MIVERRDICVSQPGRGRSGIDVSTTIQVARSLIKTNDKKRMLPVRTARNQRDKRLEKSVALSGRPVVHVISHIWDNKGKVDGRIEVSERLNVGALGWIEPNAFKTDGRTMFSDILPANTWTIDTARR